MRPDLAELVETLSEDDLNQLPFGLIQLDRGGKVLRFNQAESRLARYDRKAAIGANFFDDVAPCAKVKEFHGKFIQAVEEKNLHEVFPYVFRFKNGQEISVNVTMFYSQRTETVWLQIDRQT